jgi:hypothetical protein
MLLKVGDKILKFPKATELVPIEFNEQGEPTKFEEKLLPSLPQTEDGFRKAIQETLVWLEFQRIKQVLDQYGYKDFGDVQYWHSQDPNDEEPAKLLEWYKAYDDLIWSGIDSLSGKTFEELQNYDPVEVERQIFERTKEKLPPMEG